MDLGMGLRAGVMAQNGVRAGPGGRPVLLTGEGLRGRLGLEYREVRVSLEGSLCVLLGQSDFGDAAP